MATRKTAAKDTKDAPTRVRRTPAKKTAARQKRKPPTQISETVIKRLVEALGVGCYRSHAAAYAGVAKSAFYRWLDQGIADIEAGRPDTEHAKLHVACVQAESEAYFKAVQALQVAAPKDWRAAEAFLSRRYAVDWSKHMTGGMEHSGAVEHQVEHSVADNVFPEGVQPSMLPLKMLKEIGDELERRRNAEAAAKQN